MRSLFVAPLLAILVPVYAAAGPQWDEAAIVKSVGQKVLTKQKEKDDGDGCLVSRYFFRKSPDMVLEFRCNRVNVAWEQFKEKEFEQKNKDVAALATRAAAALAKNDGQEVYQAGQGIVFKRKPVPAGMTVGGSCSLPSCLLTYR